MRRGVEQSASQSVFLLSMPVAGLNSNKTSLASAQIKSFTLPGGGDLTKDASLSLHRTRVTIVFETRGGGAVLIEVNYCQFKQQVGIDIQIHSVSLSLICSGMLLWRSHSGTLCATL